MTLQERVVARFEKLAASPMDLKDLPAAQLKLVKDFPGTPLRAWDGIHGVIVEFKESTGGNRLTKDLLKKLLRHSCFRWITAEPDGATIGM